MTLIIPKHEQRYPTLLLKTRLEEYVRADLPPTMDRKAAIYVTSAQVLDSATLAMKARSQNNVDGRYYVGTVLHESGCLNEWDTEIATPNSPTGFISVGAYQIGSEEASRFGYALEDMLVLDRASDCMVRLVDENLRIIQNAMTSSTASGRQSSRDYADPTGKIWKDGGLRAYLAICHNHGGGYVRTTIQNYGLDWARYKVRNPHDHIVDHGYGEDCVTGGPKYPKVTP